MAAAASSVRLPPGGEGDLRVVFYQPAVGVRDVLVRVASNDPGAPEQVLTVKLEVIP